MSNTIKITLGGKKIEVPKLNVRQLREIARIFAGTKEEISFDVVQLALKRVEGAGNLDDIEAGFDEVAKAAADILVNAGLK
jgi:hypothetical protein